MTGVEGRLSSRRDRDPVRLRDFERSLRGVSYPDPPEADDLRDRRSRFGDPLRDILLFDTDPLRDLPLFGDELRDLTGEEERDACRDDGLDLESYRVQEVAG